MLSSHSRCLWILSVPPCLQLLQVTSPSMAPWVHPPISHLFRWKIHCVAVSRSFLSDVGALEYNIFSNLFCIVVHFVERPLHGAYLWRSEGRNVSVHPGSHSSSYHKVTSYYSMYWIYLVAMLQHPDLLLIYLGIRCDTCKWSVYGMDFNHKRLKGVCGW